MSSSLLVVSLASCASTSVTAPQNSARPPTDGASISLQFARAWLNRDYVTAKTFLCPSVGGPEEPPNPGLSDVESGTRALKGPDKSGEYIQVRYPRSDYHVPFTAMLDGAKVKGSVAVTLEASAGFPCVKAYEGQLDSA
jgi:hypothetical protein